MSFQTGKATSAISWHWQPTIYQGQPTNVWCVPRVTGFHSHQQNVNQIIIFYVKSVQVANMRASLYTKNPIKIGFTSFIWASFVHAFQASLPLNLDVSTSPNQKGLLATSSSEPNIRFLLSAMSSCHGSKPIQKSGDHQLIWSISHYLKGFIHVRWYRISSINSITVDDESKINCNWLSSLSYIAYFWCQKVSVSATIDWIITYTVYQMCQMKWLPH